MNSESKTIWKFSLRPAREQEIEVPLVTEILSAGVQHGTDIVVWGRVFGQSVNDKKTESRRVFVFATGEEIALSDWRRIEKFVDTVQIGGLVFHIFLGVR